MTIIDVLCSSSEQKSKSRTSHCRISIPTVVLSHLVFVQNLFFKYQINQSGTTSQYHTVIVTATFDTQTTLHMLRSKVKQMRSLQGCRLVVSYLGKLYSEQRLQSFPCSLGTHHCRKCKKLAELNRPRLTNFRAHEVICTAV